MRLNSQTRTFLVVAAVAGATMFSCNALLLADDARGRAEAARRALMSDLRHLDKAQKLHYSYTGTFVATGSASSSADTIIQIEPLHYTAIPGNTVEVLGAGSKGWWGRATSGNHPTTCSIFVGVGERALPKITCVDSTAR